MMKAIAKLNVTDRKRLVLSVGEYRGEERVDIRENVLVNKIYRPTKRGINFSAKRIEKFLKMVKKL